MATGTGKAGLKTTTVALLCVFLLAVLSVSAVAQKYEAPIAETPVKIDFWTFSVQSAVQLQAITSDCVSLYEGKCNVEGSILYDCYADAQGTCRCFTKSDTTNKCGGGTPSNGGTTPPTTGQTGGGAGSACTSDSNCASNKCLCTHTNINGNCIEGTCLQTSGSNPSTCKDSDGGVNLIQKGTATDYLAGTQVNSVTDSCSQNDPTTIFEAYCSTPDSTGNSVSKDATYACPSGTTCNNGACTSVVQKGPCTGKADFTVTNQYCGDNIAFKTVCIGGVEKTAQQTCTSLGKVCQNDECETTTPPSSGGTGGGTGGGGTGTGSGTGGTTDGTGTDCGTDVPNYNCCSYTSIDHTFCKGAVALCSAPRIKTYLWLPQGANGDCSNTANIDKVIGGNIAETSKSEDKITCINTIGTPSGCKNQQAQDYTKNQKSTGNVGGTVFPVAPASTPSLSKSVKDARESDVLKSLCINNDYCKSKICDDSKGTRDEIHKVVSSKDNLDTSLGKVDNRFDPMKLMQPVQLTGGDIVKAGEEIGGVCTDNAGFNFSQFFKDNQTMILVGGGILAAVLVLPKLLGK